MESEPVEQDTKKVGAAVALGYLLAQGFVILLMIVFGVGIVLAIL